MTVTPLGHPFPEAASFAKIIFINRPCRLADHLVVTQRKGCMLLADCDKKNHSSDRPPLYYIWCRDLVRNV